MDVRLILDPPASGPWNMAVDEALLQQAAATGQATLRFYGWQPATLSVGYFQEHADRETHAASRKLPLVRRASGGGAIVHDRELTYSFSTPLEDRFSDTNGLVHDFHSALRDCLRDWNLATTLAPTVVAAVKKPFLCFQRRSPDDLLLQGLKLAGSAQRRQRAAGLVHGSLLLGRSKWAPELPGLADLAPRPPSADQVRQSWTELLRERFSWVLIPGEAEGDTHNKAVWFEQHRFAGTSWNHRR